MRKLVLLLLLLAGPAYSQTVYKCRDASGEPVYQSFPCGGTKPAEKVWTGTYKPPTAQELRRFEENRRYWARQRSGGQASSAYYYETPAKPTERDLKKRRCAVAKQSRAQQLERLGLRRTFDDLRRLDTMVYNACSGL